MSALRVLHIEDNPDDGLLVERALGKAGLDVTVERVDSSDACRDALRSRTPDAVIVDVNLPGWDVGAAIGMVRDHGLDIPVIVVSGTVGEEVTVALMRAGAHDVVMKGNLARLAPALERELQEAASRKGRAEAEQALAESEARYRRLAENAPDIVYRYRLVPDECFEYLSPAVTAISGYTPEELCGDGGLVRRIVHPDDWDLFNRPPASERPTIMAVRWAAKDGRELWLEFHSVPIVDDNGAIVAVEGIGRDITRQKEADDAIRLSDARLRLALEAAGLTVWELDLSGDEMTVISDGAGLFKDAAPPRHRSDVLPIMHPDDRDAASKAIEERLAGGVGEVEFRLARDPRRVFVSRGGVIRNDQGKPSRVVGSVFDVTGRKRADAELQRTTKTLRAIVTSAPLAVVATDVDGRLTMWNPAAERMFGWTAAEVLGAPMPFIPPEVMEETLSQREHVLSGLETMVLESVRLRKDGARLNVDVALAPLRDAAGEIAGVIGLLADTSERVRARHELEASYDQLRRLDDERRRLLSKLIRAQEEERHRIASDVHDDSVQVLTALALRLELLHRQVDDPEMISAVEEAESAARASIARLRRLIFELRPPALDREGLATAVRLYAEQMESESGITVMFGDELAREPDEEARVIAYRVIQEALTNVVRHSRASHAEVVLENADGGVRVRICDDGVGIDLRGAVSKPGHLGVTAMRERTELAGGWLEIGPAPGSGTVVEFFVPANPSGSVRL